MCFRYNCSIELGGNFNCTPCKEIPPESYWIPFSDEAFAPCASKCNSGFYGTAMPGTRCLPCSLYMQSLDIFPPLLGGVWNNSDGICNADSWACLAGFQRSPLGLRYCCPLHIAFSLPALGTSPCNVVCEAGYSWNESTALCVKCADYPHNTGCIAGEGSEQPCMTQVLWTNSCSWTCLPPYVRWGLSCLTCSERNALASDRSKPANSSWDNSGASPDCSAWICNAGYLLSTNSEACVQYDDLLHTCASYTRCATCSLGPGCVWCNQGGCVPGIMHPLNGSVCAYSESGSPNCSCGAVGCPQECKGHHSCEMCMGDSLCGWCEGTGGCLLDMQALSTLMPVATMTAEWSSQACISGWKVIKNSTKILGNFRVFVCACVASAAHEQPTDLCVRAASIGKLR